MKPSGRDFLVYLAGPISGLTYADGQDWRNYAANLLPQEIRALSPLRSKDKFLKDRGIIQDSYPDHPLLTDTGITSRDRNDCLRSDAVLFNLLGAKTVSIGTCIEFGQADAARIPIFVVMEEHGNIHDHPIVRGVTHLRFHNLDDALEALEWYLMPEGKGTPRVSA